MRISSAVVTRQGARAHVGNDGVTIAALDEVFDLAGRSLFQLIPANEVGCHMVFRLPGTDGAVGHFGALHTIDGSHVVSVTKV